ncbi:unnamed protein product [Aphanomyces euteiches]
MSTPRTRKSSRVSQVWAFGFVAVIGGQSFAWNTGLVAGTVSYGVAVVLMGMAYLCMVLSIAEVSSVISFPGGVYGLARCTVGFYFGFLAGCCELLEYTLFVTTGNLTISQILSNRWPALLPYTPLIWLINQTITFGVVLIGGRLFWRVIVVVAIVVAMILFLYYFSAMSYADMATYSGGMDNACHGGFPQFLAVLPQASWMFSGIESLSTLSNDVTDPKQLIPRGQVASMCTLLVLSWCNYITSISLPPGALGLPSVVATMNGGFTAAFNISDATSSLLMLPSTLSMTICFGLAASNILVAMAQSKLMPSMLAKSHPRLETNVNARLVILAVSSGMCFWLLYDANVNMTIYNICMVFGFIAYIVQCASFIYLRRRHKRMKRLFVSPVGIPGAVFAMAVFGLSGMFVVFCQEDHYVVLTASTAILVLLSIYYHLFAKHRQTISPDEHAFLFAHVAKFNVKPKQKSSLKLLTKATWRYIGLVSPTSSNALRNIRVQPAAGVS